MNAPVSLQFVVENGLADSLLMEIHGYRGFSGTLTRPDQRLENFPKPILSLGATVRKQQLPPSGSYSTFLPLSEWFAFDVAGRYVLDIEVAKPFSIRTESGIEVAYPSSGRVVIDVGPRDPDRLYRICLDLEHQATGWSWSSHESLEALAHIRDPIAVPFLARFLRTRPQEAYLLVNGLKEIGDGPAVVALISHMDDRDEEIRDLARGALDWVEANTTDPMIRQKIKETYGH